MNVSRSFAVAYSAGMRDPIPRRDHPVPDHGAFVAAAAGTPLEVRL